MADEKGYQGWTNYETWAVALHIGNDEGSYTYWEQEQATACYETVVEADPKGNRDDWTEAAAEKLGAQMRDELHDEEVCPLLGDSSLYTDLLNAALGEVNWYEIAKGYIEELDRDEIEQSVRG